ncbi:amidohydrolase family protein [Polaromonas sp. OV174]|uniref:amidohydrolase family protein n=1 Tax=Polaromonas sp. OV174 TaxID=1855300 RepID=UPI000B8A4D6D|nr:amidohydrolase family protein [Polaromonas sp. OV174]
MPSTVIRNVRPLGGAAVDVVLHDGRISALLPAGSAAPELATLVDGQGQLLLPALVESHVHFDKTLWATPWRPNSAGPTRNHRISNEHTVLKDFQVPMAERAGPLIEHCIAQGSLYFRSHLDTQTVWGLKHVQEMLALREKYRHLIELQLVAFPQGGLLIAPGTLALMEQALELGVDVVGGIDPAGIDRDPIRHLEKIFELATRYRRGIDIHLHDLGELGRWEIERIADMTEAMGLQGQVVISHAYSLGAFAPAELMPLADRLAALGISIMSCAPPNVSVPPVAMLRSRGVNVCSGSDGIRDAWSPMGSGDMLERAMLMALRFGWSKDEELEMAFDVVSQGGARALNLQAYGLDVGCQANLLLLPAENIAEAVVNRSPQRTVISRGQVVAKDGIFLVA